MKKISLLLAIVLTLVCACAIFGACQPELVDYAADLKLDLSSASAKEKVTVRNYVDGDTVHFNVSSSVVSNGILKARFLGVNTPESTGKIEQWGKSASRFTKEKLSDATSIYIESDGPKWEKDSTGDRHLAWIWYRTDETSDYRLLNLELLQEGLAVPNGIGGHVYTDQLQKAVDQAKRHKLKVYSDEKDPEFFYGDAMVVTLEALRWDIVSETYAFNGSKVAVEGIVTYNTNGMCYLQDYNEEQGRFYGMPIYYGYNPSGELMKILNIGNRIRLVGKLQPYETAGTWQLSGLEASAIADPSDTNYSTLLSENNEVVYQPLTGAEFASKVDIIVDDEKHTVDFAALAMGTCVKLENLKVIGTPYHNPDADRLEMTITCQAPDGTTIVIRTGQLKMKNDKGINETVKPEFFVGKTISIIGNIDQFDGTYQIKVDVFRKITVVS